MQTGNEPSEIHISGDMNLDALNGRWFDKSYHLYSLSSLVHETSKSCNFTQLVEDPTRFQYNSITGIMSRSCIDHVHTNQKFRCSKVAISSFGNSDHNVISYVRFAKNPSVPARMIRRRSYKNFILENFLDDLRKIDCSPVYFCQDVDSATTIFTNLFRNVLNNHAPWIKYQNRTNY